MFCDTFVHPFGFSDHHLLHSHLHARGLKVNRNKSKIVCFRDYKNLNLDLLSDILVDEVWEDVVGFENVNDSVECFNIVMSWVFDTLVSQRRLRLWQISALWIGSLNRLRKTRDKAYKRHCVLTCLMIGRILGK